MEIGKTANVGLMIGLVVSLLMVGYVMMPVLNDTNEEFSTQMENEGADMYLSTEPATITFGADANLYVDSEIVGTSGLFLSDAACVFFGPTQTSGSLRLADGTTATIRNIIVTDDGFSYNTTTDTYTYTDVACEYALYTASSGDYGRFNGVSFNVDDGDLVIAFGDSPYYVADLVSESVDLCVSGTTVTTATVVSDATQTDNGTYTTWSSGAYTLTYGDEDTTITGTIAIAPIYYTDRTTEQNQMVSILEIIPVMVILCLLMLVVYRVTRNE